MAADTPLRSILAQFGFQVDFRALEEGRRRVDAFKSGLAKIGQAALGAFVGHEIKEFFSSTIEAANHLAVTADLLGLTVEQTERLKFAANAAGVSVDRLAFSFSQFQRNIAKTAQGASGDAPKAFARLGVQLKDTEGKLRPSVDVFSDVADKIAKLKTPAEQSQAAMALLGRYGHAMLPILKDGSAGVAALLHDFDKLKLGVGSDYARAAHEATIQTNLLSAAWLTLKARLTIDSLPAIKGLAHYVAVLTAGLAEMIKKSSGARVLAGALAILGGASVLFGLGKLAQGLGFAAEGLGGILALGGEALLVVGVFVLLGLAIEDIVTWLRGGKSVIGEFIDALFGVGASQQTLDYIHTSVAQISAEFSKLGPLVKAVGDALLWAIGAVVVNQLQVAKGELQAFADSVKRIVDIILAIPKAIGGAAGKVADFADVLPGGHAVAAQIHGFASGITAAAPPAPSLSGARGFGNSVDAAVTHIGNLGGGNTTNITINGANDPQGTAKAVGGAVRDANADHRRQAAAAIKRRVGK